MKNNQNRKDYETIKRLALEAYYDFCRDRAAGRGGSQADVLRYVILEFEDYFQDPLERLMYAFAQVVLAGSWDSEVSSIYRREIRNLISDPSLKEACAGVSVADLNDFSHELKNLMNIDLAPWISDSKSS